MKYFVLKFPDVDKDRLPKLLAWIEDTAEPEKYSQWSGYNELQTKALDVPAPRNFKAYSRSDGKHHLWTGAVELLDCKSRRDGDRIRFVVELRFNSEFYLDINEGHLDKKRLNVTPRSLLKRVFDLIGTFDEDYVEPLI